VAVKSPQGYARVSVTTKTIQDLFARARSGVIAAGLIAFILAAVFVPVAFVGGISGEIYKQ
jgi:multidrug efflux pump subunit AcrB